MVMVRRAVADWKRAKIAPVYKKGDRYLAENYGPIYLTCVCCKII